MSRFIYLGEPERTGVKEYGQTTAIRLALSGGGRLVLRPPDGQDAFAPGDPIGSDITDEKALKHLRLDSRFQEVISKFQSRSPTPEAPKVAPKSPAPEAGSKPPTSDVDSKPATPRLPVRPRKPISRLKKRN